MQGKHLNTTQHSQQHKVRCRNQCGRQHQPLYHEYRYACTLLILFVWLRVTRVLQISCPKFVCSLNHDVSVKGGYVIAFVSSWSDLEPTQFMLLMVKLVSGIQIICLLVYHRSRYSRMKISKRFIVIQIFLLTPQGWKQTDVQ